MTEIRERGSVEILPADFTDAQKARLERWKAIDTIASNYRLNNGPELTRAIGWLDFLAWTYASPKWSRGDRR